MPNNVLHNLWPLSSSMSTKSCAIHSLDLYSVDKNFKLQIGKNKKESKVLIETFDNLFLLHKKKDIDFLDWKMYLSIIIAFNNQYNTTIKSYSLFGSSLL